MCLTRRKAKFEMYLTIFINIYYISKSKSKIYARENKMYDNTFTWVGRIKFEGRHVVPMLLKTTVLTGACGRSENIKRNRNSPN